MRKKHVKKELQIKIKKYLEYALEVETSLDSNEAFLSTYLNQSLKNELITEIHGKILLENLVFTRFDSTLIMRTTLIMKEKIFSPEDPVFLEGENDDLSMFIIHTGRVEIFNFSSQSFLKTLVKGHYFGEISFFTGQPRSASVRSTDFSALYLVKRNEFIELMDEFPLEREKFFEIKDKLFVYENLACLNLACYSCGSTDHIVRDCPKVHISIPKGKYIEKYITKRTKFMNDYIRFGTRTSKKIDRYATMSEAARNIQIKVWEGELQVAKTLGRMVSSQQEMPELIEHPAAALIADQRKVERLVSCNQVEGSHGVFAPSFVQSGTGFGFNHSGTGGFVHSGTGGTGDKKGSQNLPSIDLDSVAPIGFGGQGELKPEIARRKHRSSAIVTSKIMTKKEKKQNVVYDDIDRIRSFTNYFPHNNFEILCPQNQNRRKTGHFDYFEQSDTAKATLKKFVTILREKVRVRREMAAKEKELGKRKSIFSKLLGGNNSPLRSRFYKESKNPGFGDSSPKNSPSTPKKKSAMFNNKSPGHSPVELKSPFAIMNNSFGSQGSNQTKRRKSSISSHGSSSDNEDSSVEVSRNRSNGSKLR